MNDGMINLYEFISFLRQMLLRDKATNFPYRSIVGIGHIANEKKTGAEGEQKDPSRDCKDGYQGIIHRGKRDKNIKIQIIRRKRITADQCGSLNGKRRELRNEGR